MEEDLSIDGKEKEGSAKTFPKLNDNFKPDYFSNLSPRFGFNGFSPGGNKSSSSFDQHLKANTIRYTSGLNLLLSPISAPSSFPAGVEEFYFDQSLNPNSTEDIESNCPAQDQPSIIDNLKSRVYTIKTGNLPLGNSNNLPDNYLNINLQNGELVAGDEYNDLDIIAQILQEYTLIKKIQQTDDSDAISSYRALHKATGDSVIIRFTSQLTLGSVSRLVNSSFITSKISSKCRGLMLYNTSKDNYNPSGSPLGINEVFPCTNIKFTEAHSCLIAVYKIQSDCVTLKDFASELKNNTLKMVEVLVNLLNIVQKIHEYGIVINTLNQINIFVKPETLETFIMGFDYAFTSVYENLNDTYRSSNKMHSASYINFTAPEYFYKSSMVDYRADIYSVGAIFHTIITGRNFDTCNFLSAVTSSLQPRHENLHEFDNRLPIELSNIISKMVEFEPSERYLSISFLIHDLSKLYPTIIESPHTFIDKNSLTTLPFTVPSKIIGRQNIKKKLMSFIKAKGVSTITVIGEPGIGKSSILESLRAPTMIRKMFYTVWKSDDSNIFQSKFQAFDFIISKLLRDVLSMDKFDIIFWRDLIISEIEVDLSALYEFVPELRILIGTRYKNKRHTDIDKILNKNELGHLYILKRLFELFSKHAGLVLIVENIEFLSEADVAVLNDLWQYLNNDLDSSDLNFILIVSINVNELTVDLKVPSFLKNTVIKLSPLTLDEVEELIGLSLQLYNFQFMPQKLITGDLSYFYELKSFTKVTDDWKKFAEQVYFQTKGNPSLIKEILIQLFLFQRYNPTISTSADICKRFINNYGLWGFKKLHSIYDHQTIQLLKYAACIAVGNSFNIYDLLVVSERNITELYESLFLRSTALTLTSASNVSKLPLYLFDDPDFILSQLSDKEKKNILKCSKYRFSHESIRKRINKLLHASHEFEEFHRLCGLRLFRKAESTNLQKELSYHECFSIAAHFLRSSKVARPNEKLMYSNVLISAGWYSYFSYEITSSLIYFQAAMEHTKDIDTLKGLKWIEIHIYEQKKQHMICLDLCNSALNLYKTDSIDYVQFLISKMQSLRSTRRYQEGYDICLLALKSLGFELDVSSMSKEEIIEYTTTVLKPILPRSISEIQQLDWRRQNIDRKGLLLQQILSEMNMFSVHVNKLYLLPFCNLINFSLLLEYGGSIYCCMSLLIIASIEAANDYNGIKKAQEYCRLGFSMFKNRTFEADEVFVCCFRFYCALSGSIIEPLDKIEAAFDLSVLNTKIPFLQSNFARGLILKFKFHAWISQGITLPHLIEKMKFLKESHKPPDDFNSIYENMYRCVAGVLDVLTGEISYEKYVDDANLIGIERMKLLHIYLIYSTNRCFVCYMNKKYELGGDIAINQILPEWKEELASIETVWGRFIFALLIYKDTIRRKNNNSDPLDAETQAFIDEAMKQNHHFFENLSIQNPSVALGKFLVIDSFMKVLNPEEFSQLDILASFEKATETCGDHQLYLLLGIAAEECATWISSISKSDKISKKFFKLAIRSYRNVGLIMKADQLESEFGPLGFELELESSRTENSSSRIFSGVSNTRNYKPMGTKFGSNKRKIPLKRSSASTEHLFISNMESLESSSDDHGISSFTTSLISASTEEASANTLPAVSDSDVDSPLQKYDENRNQKLSNYICEDFTDEIVLNLSVKLAQSDDVCEIIKSLLISLLQYFSAYYGCLVLSSDDGTPFIRAVCFNNHEVRFMSDEILSLRGDLAPAYLIQECMKIGKPIWRKMDKIYFDSNFKSRDSYFNHSTYEDVICIPIMDRNVSVGALYFETRKTLTEVSLRKIELLSYVCLQGYISINKVELFEKLEYAKKAAESATSDRSNFLANMSHEIRTPFNSLMSCAIFLLDTELTKTQKMYVETIKNSALVTLNIIDDILSFSKLEHGSIALVYKPFNLRSCIEDGLFLIAEQATSKSLELVLKDHSGIVDKIYGDRTRITQIFINLLGNAIKFTNSGYICVEINVSKINLTRYEFSIHVVDTGIGIPPGSKSKLFKPFNQLDGSSTREYGGSGLGLSISKKLAEYMGGTLDYKSKEGKGTDFCFTFSTKCEIYKETEKKFHFNNKRVVIIDSRKVSSESLKDLLSDMKFDMKYVTHKYEPTSNGVINEDADFVFIYYRFLDTPEKIKQLIKTYPNAEIILELPFGSKLPLFIKTNERQFYTDKSIQILLNPIRKQSLYDIIGSFAKDIRQQKVSAAGIEKMKNQHTIKLAQRCPLSVIIAEDNIINAKVVKLQLSRLGYESVHAKNGVELMEMFEHKIAVDGKPYDIVFMDLQMPRKDGFEATIDIKSKYGDETRVVALSANVYAEEKNRCVQVGMSGFLNKPLLPEALTAQLEGAYEAKITR